MAIKRPASALTRLRRGGFLALGGLVVWILAGLPFFVDPVVDPVPRHADVVLVLGPPLPERLAVAERLLRDGTVDAALVSVPYGGAAPPEVAAFCASPAVTCADPDPRTTRGEARMLRATAEARGWRSAVVTTMPAHLARPHDRGPVLRRHAVDGRGRRGAERRDRVPVPLPDRRDGEVLAAAGLLSAATPGGAAWRRRTQRG